MPRPFTRKHLRQPGGTVTAPPLPPAPQRIQLRRVKGWRLPDGAVIVARPGRYGNPHKVQPYGENTAAEAVALYERDLLAGQLAVTVADVRQALAGKDLACWCPPGQPCHADVLLRIANGAT